MIQFLLNAVICGAIFGVLVYGYFKNYKKEILNKATNWLSVILLGYFLIFLFSVLWLVGKLEFGAIDFEVIYSVAIFLQTLILFKVVYVFNNKKETYYLLIFYFAAFLAFVYSLSLIFNFILIISFLLTLILGIDFMNLFVVRRRAAYALIIYSLISVLFEFFRFLNFGERFFFSIFSNVIFLVFCAFFLKDVDKYPKKSVAGSLFNEESQLALFVKYFIYIIVIINLVLISTVGVHEFAHVAVGRYYGCESRAIVYEEGAYPYSEVLCENDSSKFLITLAGPIFPLLIALILLFVGGSLLRPFAFLIIGFNSLASYRDFADVGLSANLNIGASVFGGICLIIGIFLLARGALHERT